MTPDELDTLANRCSPGRWYVNHLDVLTAGIPDAEVCRVATVSVIEDVDLIALAPTLARDHAALLRWADDVKHYTRRRDQALTVYWDYFAEGAVKTPRHGWTDPYTAETWWLRYEKYKAKVNALLSEYDERWSS